MPFGENPPLQGRQTCLFPSRTPNLFLLKKNSTFSLLLNLSGRCGRRLSPQRGWRTKQQSGENDSACRIIRGATCFGRQGETFPKLKFYLQYFIIFLDRKDNCK